MGWRSLGRLYAIKFDFAEARALRIGRPRVLALRCRGYCQDSPLLAEKCKLTPLASQDLVGRKCTMILKWQSNLTRPSYTTL